MLSLWNFLRFNLWPALVAFLGVLLWVTRKKAEKNEDLIQHYETKEEAREVRERPVPTDKRDILDRM